VKRYVAMFVTLLGTLLVAAPAFAQGTTSGGGSAENTKWVIITAGFAMDCFRSLWLCPVEGHRSSLRRLGAQSRRPARHSVCPGFGTGID